MTNQNIKKPHRSKSYVLTINPEAYTDEINYDNLDKYVYSVFKKEKPVYFCYGEEKANLVHMHLYLELPNQISFASMCKKFPKAHVDVRLGSPTQARDYVFKPEGMTWDGEEKSHTVLNPAKEFGDFTKYKTMRGYAGKKQKRSVNEEIEYMLDYYDNLADMADYNAWVYNQMRRTIEQLFYERKIENFKDNYCTCTKAANGDIIHEVNRKVYYLYGVTACGKTKGITRQFGNDVSILTQLKSGMNYDDYKNTGAMVLDEFYGQLTIQEMLNLLDGYITELPCRYNNRANVAHTIIMTSNVPFDALYKEAQILFPQKYAAFIRRVNAGVWEMYQTRTGDRYIACQTQLAYIEERLRGNYDLSKPPIALSASEDGAYSEIKHITALEMQAVQYLDSLKTVVTAESIQAYIDALPF